jgi:hypothetical protein
VAACDWALTRPISYAALFESTTRRQSSATAGAPHGNAVSMGNKHALTRDASGTA